MDKDLLKGVEVDEILEYFYQNGKLGKLWFRFAILRRGECGKHAYHVARISRLIGLRMGMSLRELDILFLSALLHDIGKLSINEEVLLKPWKLNEDEYRHIQNHVRASYYILSQVRIPNFSELISNVWYHHEAVNGQGYPFGKRSSEIPIGAKIIAVADVYDAISANRSYNHGGSSDMAFWELRKKRNEKFDSRVVDIFCSLIERGII